MSLQPRTRYRIPKQTARVAQAAFPNGNLYLQMADAFGLLYRDEDFTALFPQSGQPTYSPARLALATIMQFAEGLSDRQAADAVRSRIDWKYALALELQDPGFDHTVLSEFRSRLVAGGAELLLLDKLLTKLQERKLLKAHSRQRTDSTHVLAAVRTLNRLERVGETLRHALNSVAVAAPDWLRKHASAEWYERYERRIENYHLPKTDAERNQLAITIHMDGQTLLRAIDEASDLRWLCQIPAINTLRLVWAEQYIEIDGQYRLREVKDMPSPAKLIASPYDIEARYSTKRDVEWVGYKVHLTETCDEDAPRLIVNVETTPATTPDDNMIAVIHESLQKRDLLPAEHLVDKGYTDSQMLVQSEQEYNVIITGPVADDPSWQARSKTGFDKSQFQVDWEQHIVTCPAGKQSISWLANSYRKNGIVWEARFARKDCSPCPHRSECTRAKVEPRLIGLQEREDYEALQKARQRQATQEFQKQYAARAGIEATHEQAIRRCGLRHSRYVGMAKTHLQHVLTATAINVVRVSEWLGGKPIAKTRRSPFGALNLGSVNK
jgi:transposase